jgi:hypothetical protein
MKEKRFSVEQTVAPTKSVRMATSKCDGMVAGFAEES